MKRLSLILAFLTTASSTQAEDWRQFRGNQGNSIATGENLPTELSGGSIAWKVELPGRGVSSPIAVKDQILLTASSGYDEDRLHVMSFDAAPANFSGIASFKPPVERAVMKKCVSPHRLLPAMASECSRFIPATI